MTENLEQARHNERFHSSLCSSYSEQYFDWKITSLFYGAYHLLKALSDHWNVEIGDRHHEIMWNINPRNPNRTMMISKKAFESYDQLFEYSWTSRYSGFTDFDTFQALMKGDHIDAKRYYDYFRNYVIGQGVPVEDSVK
jgi:hypothetical protein